MTLENIKLQCNYLNLDDEFYSISEITSLRNPYLVSKSNNAIKLINLDIKKDDESLFIELLNGNYKLKGSNTFSMCYAGHQFGNFNPRLGDGRAINFGKSNGWNLQLKGSGETYYSRTDDGRASLDSSIREYLMSEAMHGLGIPTTRALGIIASKEKIFRNGAKNTAIVLRASTSWIRFGTFEYFHYIGEHDKLKDLADYVIEESYSHLSNDKDKYYKMFCEILNRTALTIAKWQGVGFNHGVMNTDNMSIEGLTIDYGPYSMLDDFNFNHVCNNSDKAGRYAYGEQPNISYWNLTKLAKALGSLVPKEKMNKKLDEYGESIYPNAYLEVMRLKLGLYESIDNDMDLIESLIKTLHIVYVDYTLFLRTLSTYDGNRTPLYDIAMEPMILDEWLILYDARLLKETISTNERNEKMLKVNPKYVLKNYMLEKAIKLAYKDDFSMVDNLLEIAHNPYESHLEFDKYSQDTPEEFKNIALSCSS